MASSDDARGDGARGDGARDGSLHAPLLAGGSINGDDGAAAAAAGKPGGKAARVWHLRLPRGVVVPVDATELATWWTLTWTTGVSQLLRSSPPFIDTAFLGHLGTPQLAAAACANVLVAMSTIWLWSGTEEALSTVASQAHGHGNARLVGVWLQLACAVTLAIGAAVGVSWLFSDAILTGLGFNPPSMTALAQTFSRWYLLTLAPLLLFSTVSAWLNAIGHTTAVLVANVAGVTVSIVANYFLIFGTTAAGGGWGGLGFIGSPIASGVAAFATLAMVAVWARWRRLLAPTWPGCCPREMRSPRRIRAYMAQALPNFFGAALETLQLQIMSTLAAHLGEAQLATHNALITLYMVVTCFMMGAIRATTLSVGNALGRRRIDLGKQAMGVSLVAQTVLGCGTAGVLYGARRQLCALFSDDPQVWTLGAEVMGPLALSLVLYSVMFSAIGVLLGQGKPGVVAACVFVGNWAVAVPLAFVFTHVVGMGLMGIWLALLTGYAVVTVALVVALVRTDWQAAVDAAIERSAHDDAPRTPHDDAALAP